jgi:hypothetical protein
MSTSDASVPDAGRAASTPAPSTTGGPGTSAKPAKKKHSPLLSLLAIALAIVGGFLNGWSFLTGLHQIIDLNKPADSIYIALFFVGLGILIVGIVFALVGLVRRAQLILSIIALILSMLPSVVVLTIAALLYL